MSLAVHFVDRLHFHFLPFDQVIVLCCMTTMDSPICGTAVVYLWCHNPDLDSLCPVSLSLLGYKKLFRFFSF